MKSRSKKLPAVPPLDLVPELREAVLLKLAEDLGPSLDVLDVAVVAERRELAVVSEFVQQDGPTPAEVRVALKDLKSLGCVEFTDLGTVRLSMHGLVLARRIRPEVGRPKTPLLRFELQTEEKGSWGILKMGVDGIDATLRRSGVHLACFVIFHVRGLSVRDRLSLDDVGEELQKLAARGLGPRSGPGDRMKVSKSSISKALDDLARWRLLLLKQAHDDRDERSRRYWVDGPMPSVVFSKPESRLDPDNWRDYIAGIASYLGSWRPSPPTPAEPPKVSTAHD